MSSDSDFVSEQKGLISDELNWSILDVFLWGRYYLNYRSGFVLTPFEAFTPSFILAHSIYIVSPITFEKCTIFTHHYTPTLPVTKKSSKNKFIIWAVSLSYWAYSAMAIISWYRNQSAVVSHSETRIALFSALWLGPQWPALVMDAMEFVMAAVADGILVRTGFNSCRTTFLCG